MKRTVDEIKSIRILKARNGVALIAVLAILLILTLLLPVMFTMSERATENSMKGMDKQRAAYLARTTIEMAVAAFEKDYENNPGNYADFLDDDKPSPTAEEKAAGASDPHTFLIAPVYMYEKGGEYVYTTNASDIFSNVENQTVKSGIAYLGKADGTMKYINQPEYYKISNKTQVSEKISAEDYNEQVKDFKDKIYQGTLDENEYQYVKIDNRIIEFVVNGTAKKQGNQRKCRLVLPTDAAEMKWILPASKDGVQVFADSTKATNIVNMDMKNTGKGGFKQPLYIFSCQGNMKISFDNLSTEDNIENKHDKTSNTQEAATVDTSNLSFGVYPLTSTDPANDPDFSCFKATDMHSWHDGAQKDNFIALTCTETMQWDVPIKLLVNPCRVGGTRLGDLGDGLSTHNYSLYKVLICQAPQIVFNKQIDIMVSLYMKDNAVRMTSLTLSAPSVTQYSYDVKHTTTEGIGSHKEEVTTVTTIQNAGKVMFMQDVNVWFIPYGEKGSATKWIFDKTAGGKQSLLETRYYKGSDVQVIKMFKAGDVYLYNAAKVDSQSGKKVGFSLAGYFTDVFYKGQLSKSVGWWNVMERLKGDIFNDIFLTYKSTYTEDDLYSLGNIYDGTYKGSVPDAENYVIYWES